MDELDSGKKYSLGETLRILMTSPCANDNLDISQDDPSEHVDDENGSMGHFDAHESTCEDLLQLNDMCDEIISSNLIEEAKEMLQGVSDFKNPLSLQILYPGKTCGTVVERMMMKFLLMTREAMMKMFLRKKWTIFQMRVKNQIHLVWMKLQKL